MTKAIFPRLKETVVALGAAVALATAGTLPSAVAHAADTSTQIAACNPCNPCAVKVEACNPCNPCATKKLLLNPCAAKNPCNPCNPCAAKNPCNPCAAN